MKVITTVLTTLGVLAAVGVGAFFYLGQQSKSGTAPGMADGALAPCPDAPNCISSEPGTPAEKEVEPFALDTWDALPAAIEGFGGVLTKRDDAYIAAEFTSATFGFVDDLELRKSEDSVHVRSASRVGYSDAGVNAKRVADLRAKLTE